MQPVSQYSPPHPIDQPSISQPTPTSERNISNLATEILLIENRPPPLRTFLVGDPELGMNELWNAAKLQRWDTVLELLKKHPFDVNVSPIKGEDEGKTALWMACADEKWDVVTEMLKGHCNVNAGPTSGSYAGTTVLWIATYHQQWTLVQDMLTRTGVDVNKVPTKFDHAPGPSPLSLALYHEQWDIAFELLKHNCENNEREDFFRIAISKNQWEIVKVMLKQFSCDVNKSLEGDEGWTPLYLAASCNRWEIVQLMLDTCVCSINAGPNNGDEQGSTVLFLAAAARKENIVRKLLSIPGCDVNASFQGRTPLWFFKDKITDLTTWLLLLGARIDETKIDEVTPEEELEIHFLEIYQNHLNNILHSFTEVITDPYTANPFLKLPRDLLELFLCEIFKRQFPLLREIPASFVINKCKEIREKILIQKNERAIIWFTKQAYGALKKRVTSEQLPRFHDFHANWNMIINKCIAERKFSVFNRKIRAYLIASIQYNSYPFDYRTMLETVVGVLSREPIMYQEENKKISTSIDKENDVNQDLALAVSHRRWDVVPVLLTQPGCNVNISIGEKGMTPHC
ncbi:MAG: ankyrin repeat domain-containing protein [Parachlamydia sp.]|nr:ankyrin repeat domain-containing protein [Parachlamydia sp.]